MKDGVKEKTALAKPEEEITEGDNRTEDVITHHRPQKIEHVEQLGPCITFITKNKIELLVRLITPEIIRITYLLDGDVKSDFSYAIDPAFKAPEINYSLIERGDYYIIETEALNITIEKSKLFVHFSDKKGNVLCKDKQGFYRRDSLMKGISEVKVTKKALAGEQFFGLGDKTVNQNMRGQAFENWNTDSYAYERGDDPLYRTIPFYLSLLNGRSYGIFMDNPYRSRFNFDEDEKGATSFSAEGGVMDYYFIYGPELTTVTERYTLLTGTPDMPPMWALGYHQCRWSYFPEARVKELAQNFREKKIPCDAIYLDIDYMDEYRCFTWNSDHFPDAKEMITDLDEQGYKTIVMIDPGIKVDENYFVYREGIKNNYFCRRPDGELMIGPVWPARCVFPDYTNPVVRSWWNDLHESFLTEMGLDGVWNDMNEPAVFEVKSKTFPLDIRHDYDGQPCSHKKAHNLYGMQMARASLEGIKKHAPSRRPFLLTRANFSGGQRYAALWTGDNIATWDHLKLANEQCQRLSISGYSFVGSDVGGFVKQPSGELMCRWLQLGVFHPLFRNHTMGYNVDGAAAVKKEQVELQKNQINSDQEPWAFGDKYTVINRQAINLRYRLLSYLYTAFWSYIQRGTPILRPVVFEDQSDQKASEVNDSFLFGRDILVAPVLNKGQTKVNAYLPKGNWYNFWNNRKIEGSTYKAINAPIEQIPFLVRAGTVLPLREVMQHTGERDLREMQLNVYHAEHAKASQLFEDAEEGWGYKKNDYRLITFKYEYHSSSGKVTFSAMREGNFNPSYNLFELQLIGLPFEPEKIQVDGTQINFECSNSIYKMNVPADFNEVHFLRA